MTFEGSPSRCRGQSRAPTGDTRDFRVGGKIFATLSPVDGRAMVKLTPEEQEAFVRAVPDVYTPVKGGWGRGGATTVRLAAATKAIARGGLVAAWRARAPKQLVRDFNTFKAGRSPKRSPG
jgi:hypothetical protein